MNLAYCDPGLRDSLGHHANNARAILPALARLGHTATVHGPKRVTPALSAELAVRPSFRHSPYERGNLDRYAGWLHDFNVRGVETLEDLTVVGPDRVYWSSAQPTQLFSLLTYLHQKPDARAVLEFGTGPGLATRINEEEQTVEGAYPSPHENPTATLLRYCSFLLNDSVRPRLTLATFDARASALFEAILDCPVQTFPVPRDAVAVPRLRGTRPALTVALLGHQRNGDKGYQLAVPLVREVLERSRHLNRSVRWLIHNGDPDGWSVRDIQAAVRRLATEYPAQITVDERTADAAVWQELLDASDLVVCPYWPERFHASYSAVCCEAVANGIPMVVPNRTSLSATMFEFGCGIEFDQWDVASIARAVLLAVDNFDGIAGEALDGVEKWRASHGGERTARAIVEGLA